MNNFIYDIPTKVYFGKGQLGNLGQELAKLGSRVLLTYGGGTIKKTGLYDKVVREIEKAGLKYFELDGIEPNPRHTTVNKGADICKRENIDVLLAVGGGSVIDCTKMIGVAALYEGDCWDIVTDKVQGKGCLPIVTVLTLSATGTEMNFNAVISNIQTNDKIGIKYPPMRPKVSFLDPTNTFTVNKYQTACGGADICSHIMENYFNIKEGSYMLDTVMEGLMKTVIKYVPIALKEPSNYEARANIMWASSWALNGFINGGNMQAWTCHAIEHQLSAYYDITHGLGLAIITPRWMEYVLDESTVRKFYQFGVNVFDIDKNLPHMEVAKKAIELFRNFLFNICGLASTLTAICIDETNFDAMANKAATMGYLQYAFKPLTGYDVKKILQNSL